MGLRRAGFLPRGGRGHIFNHIIIRGGMTVKVLRWVGWLSTVMVPGWASPMNWAMLWPRPQPSARRDKLRSIW